MSSPWVIWVGPKCNHRCPYKRQAEGDLTTAEEKDMSPQKQKLEWQSQETEMTTGWGCSLNLSIAPLDSLWTSDL